MIFIKNLCGKEIAEKTKLILTKGEPTKLTLKVDETDIDLVTTDNNDVTEILVKVIGKIRTMIGMEDEFPLQTRLLDRSVTEISFFIKQHRTVLKPLSEDKEGRFMKIDSYDEVKEKKFFPRDMIVLIVPKATDKIENKITIDKRNFVGIHDKNVFPVGELCDVHIFYSKYPIWKNMKFPAYICMEQVAKEEIADFEPKKFAIKLGYVAKDKVVRNKLIEVDYKEAVDYVKESTKEKKPAPKKPFSRRPAPRKDGTQKDTKGFKPRNYNGKERRPHHTSPYTSGFNGENKNKRPYNGKNGSFNPNRKPTNKSRNKFTK